MALNLMDLFKRIKWAKNGDITDMSQTDYEIGWAHLGDDTPTVEDFNLVQQLADRKDQWLFGQIDEVLKANNIEPTEQNAQAFLQALQKMLLSVSNKAKPKTLTATTTNAVDETGHTHALPLGSITQKGVVQLTNDTGLDSEVLALTAKAGKALSQRIAGLETTTPQKLNTKVDKTAISNAVNSTSTTTVASSQAVKTAYDKGVEALNKANDKVGWGAGFGKRYAEVFATDGQYAGFQVTRTGASGSWQTRIESLPDKQFKFWVQNSHDIYLPAKGGTVLLSGDISNAVNSTSATTVASSQAVKTAYDKGVEALNKANAANDNANGRVAKTGDTLTGHLFIKQGDYSSVRTYNNAGSSVRWESLVDSSNTFAAITGANKNEEVVFKVQIPKGNGVVVLDSSVSVNEAANKIVKRDNSGDVFGRLFRSTYQDEARCQGAIAFRVNSGNDNFTRYCNNPAAVRTWLGVNDIATRNITRKNYSKNISGTKSGYTNKTMAVTGEVITHPDGTIEQYFKISSASLDWFAEEPAIGNHERGFRLVMSLWTAMPNKVLNATIQLSRPANNSITYLAEAGEWVAAWSSHGQGNSKNSVCFDYRRFTGATGEPIDILIKAEGY